MKEIVVRLNPSYKAYVGTNILDKLRDILYAYYPRIPVLITSKTVWDLWKSTFLSEIRNIFSDEQVFILPDGEKAKSFNWYRKILEFLVEVDKDKSSIVVVALGGGAVGDVAGFAAGTYRRGVPIIQVPTTLLSQVDSCLGGKTAINLKKAKNMVGMYHQPDAIVIDTKFLRTLSKRRVVEGMAEVIKYGIIWDYEFFVDLEKIARNVCLDGIGWDKMNWVEIVYRSLKVKAEIVSQDERETHGLRFLLNFGHTVGHVIEWMSKFSHGESVALGMMVAIWLSQRRGFISSNDVGRVSDLLKKCRLPVKWKAREFSWERFWDILGRDKKFLEGKFRFVLIDGIGSAKVVSDVSEKEIQKMVERLMAY